MHTAITVNQSGSEHKSPLFTFNEVSVFVCDDDDMKCCKQFIWFCYVMQEWVFANSQVLCVVFYSVQAETV